MKNIQMRRLVAGVSVLPALLALLAGNGSEALAQTNATTGGAVPFQTGSVQGTSVTNPASATTNNQARPRRGRGGRTQGPPTLGLDQGFLDIDTPDFSLQLVKASQTISALKPKGAGDFDFTPADQLNARAGNHYYQLGDITFRIRPGNLAGDGAWTGYSTAADRKPVNALTASGQTLASADLTPTLPDDCPLQVTRNWRLDDGKLVLEFVLKNKTSNSVVIGSLGIPLVFNNYITGRTLPQAHEICSFSDPAINEDGGYVQVTRLSGHGPALVVVPEGKTPLEAYNPILNEAPSASTRVFTDLTPRAQTFEGFYEWLVHSQAYAENEWKHAQEWNPATSETLEPGATRTIGLKFLVSPEIRDIEKTLAASHRPVAVGIPGYILPMDMDARLFLNYPGKVTSITSDPDGAVEAASQPATKDGWQAYAMHGKKWGRARVTVNYADGTVQTIQYYVIKPEAQAVDDLGNFLFTKQWYVDPSDPFHRSPSVMTYDRGHNRIVTQDARAWIAGLEDEGGSGSWVAAAMKELGRPKKEEVAKFQEFVDGVLWGGIQYSNGPREYGVRKSMFYWDPKEFTNYYDPNIEYGGWTSWNKQGAEAIDRAYNYPHVVAAYWVMYRLARNHTGLVTDHPWDWYLEQAYQTTKFLGKRSANGRSLVGYIDTGLMEGDVFVSLLKDLKREGWTDKAADIEEIMKRRADVWKGREYPFGSEMAWDSTGQEEVFAWTKFFGYDEKAEVSLNSVLGYMPTIPDWGYNGNARRYWDFYYGAAPGGELERQIHHYGSGINAIPVLASFRTEPNDYYLLRVGYAGTMAPLSNIDPDGFAAAAFHSSPALLRWDTYSGDYGPNFFGHAFDTATYVIDHPEFGWQAFGGNVTDDGNWVKIKPVDSFRSRVYVAPRGLWLTLDAGTFDGVEVNTATHEVRVELSAADEYTPTARLRIEQPAKVEGVGTYHPTEKLNNARDAFEIPLKSSPTEVVLSDSQ